MINAQLDKRWKQDMTAAATRYNEWFLDAGSQAYRDARARFVEDAEELLVSTEDLTTITPDRIRLAPASLATLRMATAPPLARDRLVTLANTVKPLITTLEQGRLPARMSPSELDAHLGRICVVLRDLLDLDLFGWLRDESGSTHQLRDRAKLVVADRRCDAVSDVILRQAQRRRQRTVLEGWLQSRGYREQARLQAGDLTSMDAGTYTLAQPVVVGGHTPVDIAVDAVIQPFAPAPHRLPVIVDAVPTAELGRSDRTRKDTMRTRLLQRSYGPQLDIVLLLGGVVDAGYLRSQAEDGLDWVWEHRIDDLVLAGL